MATSKTRNTIQIDDNKYGRFCLQNRQIQMRFQWMKVCAHARSHPCDNNTFHFLLETERKARTLNECVLNRFRIRSSQFGWRWRTHTKHKNIKVHNKNVFRLNE